MLPSLNSESESIRVATTDDYDQFFVAADFKASAVSAEQALEESFFLGLRLNRGVDLRQLREEFGEAVNKFGASIDDLLGDGLLTRSGENLRLTNRGRLLSNEVFGKFIEIARPAISTVPEAS